MRVIEWRTCDQKLLPRGSQQRYEQQSAGRQRQNAEQRAAGEKHAPRAGGAVCGVGKTGRVNSHDGANRRKVLAVQCDTTAYHAVAAEFESRHGGCAVPHAGGAGREKLAVRCYGMFVHAGHHRPGRVGGSSNREGAPCWQAESNQKVRLRPARTVKKG